ncbi:MAG: YihY/virulence factor BrkB family protein [Treponemataceae bacterium]|nr:YihY/virulence factor BrkB family protein [Treponemataceae bacterium]
MKNTEFKFKKFTLKNIGQVLYLTTKFFMKNNLPTYASACSLGFLFSFIPIMVIVLIIIIQLFHMTPDILFKLFDLPSIFVDSEKIVSIAESITAPGKVSFITIILVISIFWMGQRFFFSVKNGMNTIFHLKTIKRRPLTENVILILGEILLLVGIILLIFIFITARTILSKQSVLNNFVIPYLPKFITTWIKGKVFNILPFAFILVLSTIMYKFGSGSKPKLGSCFLAALMSTLSFWLVTFLMNSFMDIARYNLVYGILSNVIIMLLEVYIFFVLYFFAAQSIFVRQFFNSLLISELYLWDKSTTNNYTIKESIKQWLFAVPSKLLSEDNKRIILKADEIIYEENSETDGIYYIIEGQVETYKDNYLGHIGKGEFFGDLDCILDQNRSFTAKTTVPTALVFITKKEFENVIANDPEVPQKMVDSVPDYIKLIYGRK